MNELTTQQTDPVALIYHAIEVADNFTDIDTESIIERLLAHGNQSIDQFVLEHISYYDALEFVQSTDDFAKDAIEHLDCIGELPLHIPAPEKLAYHLAYEDPELGTQLLDELLYYRERGRL